MQNIEEMYKEYAITIYKYIFCLTQDANLAEEITQETFYKAIQNINKFRGECKISVWLIQIAKHLLYKEYKKKKRIISVEESLNNIEYEDAMEENIIREEENNLLTEELKKLDKTTKKVMLYRTKGELSFKEIADIFGKNETWARVTYYRGKEKIKKNIIR